MPYFETLFSKPFLTKLLIAALNKLDPDLSEQETNFEYVNDMLQSVSLFNEYGDLLAIYGDDAYDVDKPIALSILQQCTATLKPRTVVAVFVGAVRQLLVLLQEYRDTYNTVGDNSVFVRKKLLDRMIVIITDLQSSGNVSAEQFYTMYNDYVSLKERSCKICTVCGVRRPVDKLKDALPYFELLEATTDQVDVYNALIDKNKEDDKLGRLAQKCFHIEELKGRFYHFLDFDEEKFNQNMDTYDGLDPTQDPLFSLCSSGVPRKLPSCDDCFTCLRKRFQYLVDCTGTVASENCPPLPKFCFKERDFGRIPAEMPALTKVGRTAISPFVAFIRILQLRNPIKGVDSGQQATSGVSFSIGTDTVKGKEFFVPMDDVEFCKSYTTSLPREDVASKHRIFFLGDDKQWGLMERRLNKMNIGLDFNINDSLAWIDLLKRTEVFHSEIERRRESELERLVSDTKKRITSISETIASVDGVVVENNKLLMRVAESSTDDVAGARSVVTARGVKSDVPGITSSLFANPNSYGGDMPALNAMLKKIKNRTSDRVDKLLLGLEKILPNEFVNFPTITALTFPDKFPIPISEHHFMGTSMMNSKVRQHMLDHYDGRFCDVDLIF